MTKIICSTALSLIEKTDRSLFVIDTLTQHKMDDPNSKQMVSSICLFKYNIMHSVLQVFFNKQESKTTCSCFIYKLATKHDKWQLILVSNLFAVSIINLILAVLNPMKHIEDNI